MQQSNTVSATSSLTTEGIRDRFKDASWFGIQEPILVGGCGGIGSWFTFFAARAGFELFVYDFDSIEEHNLGGQLFSKKFIDKSKVQSMQAICKEFSENRINAINTRYTEDSETNHIMVGCFDNMVARRTFFDKWKEHVMALPQSLRGKCLLIDGRLEAETFQIYCVSPETMDAYESEGLFSDDEVTTEASCTLKQTSHVAAMVGSQMFTYLTNFLSNIKITKNIRRVPFFTQYSAAMNYHKSRNKPDDTL